MSGIAQWPGKRLPLYKDLTQKVKAYAQALNMPSCVDRMRVSGMPNGVRHVVSAFAHAR
jgi:hypothetical protein